MIAWSRARRGREQIPDPRRHLYIEASGRCNLECRFCAYRKKTIPKTIMAQAVFQDTANQAIEMGYRTLGLTPSTGDVFMDPDFLEKLEYLEKSPNLESYAFFTNFILPSEEKIRALCGFQKLRQLSLSIYGHDEASFVKVTGSNSNAYERLVDHLETLCRIAQPGPMGPVVNIRTERSFRGIDRTESRLCRTLVELRNRLDTPVYVKQWYDNWGGKISSSDVEGLDIHLVEETLVPKRGACALIFSRNNVMADGRVNACACRDVDGTLALGSVHEQPLAEILSLRNPKYRDLIDRQQAGDFDPVCRSCTAYQSVYKVSNPFYSRAPTVTLAEFERQIG